jgi:hypothetical protein
MHVKQISLKSANAFVMKHHRHHLKVQGHKYSISCVNVQGDILGIAICGRPLSRFLDDGNTIEITRLAVVSEKRNVCSFLYGASCRIAKELGYVRVITYSLKEESSISLKAAGFHCEEENAGGKTWKRNDGFRTDEIIDLFGTRKKYPNELKKRWIRYLRKGE